MDGSSKIKSQDIKSQVKDATDIFRDQINHFGKQVRIYDGSFKEFEPGKRPSFFVQYLNWHKHRTVDWGMFSWVKKLFLEDKPLSFNVMEAFFNS